jgi:LytS/YehU family sensor histidine kinase
MNFHISILWIGLVLVLLWVGNRLITRALSKYLPWQQFGNIRYFAHLLAGIIYLLLISNLAYFTLKIMLTEDLPRPEQIVAVNVYASILFIPVFSLYFGLVFLKNWRETALQSEKLQKENIRSQLELLKSQLDPHFLFNNLNILSSLIDLDMERSKIFLQKFSEVYRLILKSRSEDLISLREELQFIDAYAYLLSTRFGETIQILTSVPDKYLGRFLPPLSLQILVENAIKHNLVSETKPLRVEIQMEEDQLLVQNNLNLKQGKANEKSGKGLENIRRRFQYYGPRNIQIEKSDTHFRVLIPLLEKTAL